MKTKQLGEMKKVEYILNFYCILQKRVKYLNIIVIINFYSLTIKQVFVFLSNFLKHSLSYFNSFTMENTKMNVHVQLSREKLKVDKTLEIMLFIL